MRSAKNGSDDLGEVLWRAKARYHDWLIDDSHESFVVKNEGHGAAIHASYTVSVWKKKI
jgi:hypothetical protein